MEADLAQIWSEVLGIDQVGTRDNFVDLGGSSLAAMQVVARVFARFDVDLSVERIFADPTILGLTRAIDEAASIGGKARSIPIERISRNVPSPPSYGQERLWLLDRMQPNSTAYSIPRAWTLTGPLNCDALRRSLNELVARHESLRTSFTIVDGRPSQVVNAPITLDVEVVDLAAWSLREQEIEVQRLAVEQLGAPYDLSQSPLVRSGIVRLAADKHVLILCIHHICWDRWSANLLLRELSFLYTALSAGRAPSLPSLAFQYVDYAVWQRRLFTEGFVDDQMAYWTRQLADAPFLTTIPTTRRRPEIQVFEGASEPFVVPKHLAERIRSFSRQNAVTPFMTLLTVFNILLHQMTGQNRIVVGTDVASRPRLEFEGVVGFFLNQLVLHTDLSGNPSFVELLDRVRTVTLGAYANQDVPFQQLVQHFRLQRTPSYNPLFQILFTLHDIPADSFALPKMEVNELDLSRDIAVFDLSVIMASVENGSIDGAVRYNTSLFTRETVMEMIGKFTDLARAAMASPYSRLSSYRARHGMANSFSASGLKAFKGAVLEMLGTTVATPVVLPQDVIRTSFQNRDQQLPLIIEPTVTGLRFSAWALEHQQLISEYLSRHGALLFRGFNVDSVGAFEEIVRSVGGPPIDYSERSSPRTLLSRGIYTSTDHPASKHILLHNEQSYTLNWPMKIWFCCLQPSAQGGRTLLADVRRVYSRLDSAIVQRFTSLSVLYVRRFLPGLGLSWQEAFQTTDKAAVDEYCRLTSIEWEWTTDGQLITRQLRPAVCKHPVTSELVWFNHASFFHASGLESSIPSDLLREFEEKTLPFNTYYGDGTPIAVADLTHIREALRAETVGVEWERGDLLLVDNMLVAHGRESFVGPRNIVVAMTEPYLTSTLDA